METIFIILSVGALCIACFFIGAKVGQTVSRGEDLKLPKNPVDAVIERNETRETKREATRESAKLNTILENIKNYNGTSNGQKDVPKG